MAYRCVHCEEIYEDGSKEIIEGCTKCKSKFFFYIKPERLKEILENKSIPDLTSKEKKQIEEDIRDIVSIENDDEPVFLDFESIRILKPGKYLLDLTKLFTNGEPRIYQLEDGKYIVDLAPKKGVIRNKG